MILPSREEALLVVRLAALVWYRQSSSSVDSISFAHRSSVEEGKEKGRGVWKVAGRMVFWRAGVQQKQSETQINRTKNGMTVDNQNEFFALSMSDSPLTALTPSVLITQVLASDI